MDEELKFHWENVYDTKPFETMSWYQPYPTVSMEIIKKLSILPNAAIIDVGGGDGFLVDALLKEGFEDITVLDISSNALQRVKKRLGDKSVKVSWENSDIRDFKTTKRIDLWHDRAAFHFLRAPDSINQYVAAAAGAIECGGHLVIGTFSDHGPQNCSGLQIQQYTEQKIAEQFSGFFDCIKFERHPHQTPSGKEQEFLFSVMRRK